MATMSSGLKNWLFASGSFISAFNRGVIELYSGPPPTDADAAVTGTLLGKITQDGGTFTPGSPTNGLQFMTLPQIAGLTKLIGTTWTATITSTGTVGWWRLRGNATDAGVFSTALPRVDGNMGGQLDELYLPDTAVTSGDTINIELFLLNFS